MASIDRSIRRAGPQGPRTRDTQAEKPYGSRKYFWGYNVAVLAVTGFVAYELFPHFTQNVVFDGILRNGWYFGPLAVIIYVVARYIRKNVEVDDIQLGKHRRPIAITAFATIVTALWCMFVYSGTDYLTHKVFASNFTPRSDLIPSAPDFIRFTPTENACNDIANSISTTGENVDCHYTAPIITRHGFGYAAPITPHGILNVFLTNNPGFMNLDDSLATDRDPTKRLVRLDDEQAVGPGMEWFDNLQYALAKNDFFANYDVPHYLVLDDSKPNKLTLVVPKIKYAWLWRLPYWGGVVIVHSDGTLEDLTAEQAKADPRLKGKWIYPMSLARHYVEIQNYGLGYGIFTPYWVIKGKLEVENLKGSNQFPFLSQGMDDTTYLVTATKGQGTARGLQRMYFVNASNGNGTFHQFGTHDVVYGANASQDRLTNISGYQWYHEDGKGGTGQMIATEPVYIVRPDDSTLYWKFTITNVKNSGISATAVANAARPDDIKVFIHRTDFESWLRGNEAAATSSSGAGIKEELLKDIESLARQLNSLKSRAELLPDSP
jgi:hypothetical protein